LGYLINQKGIFQQPFLSTISNCNSQPNNSRDQPTPMPLFPLTQSDPAHHSNSKRNPEILHTFAIVQTYHWSRREKQRGTRKKQHCDFVSSPTSLSTKYYGNNTRFSPFPLSEWGENLRKECLSKSVKDFEFFKILNWTFVWLILGPFSPIFQISFSRFRSSQMC